MTNVAPPAVAEPDAFPLVPSLLLSLLLGSLLWFFVVRPARAAAERRRAYRSYLSGRK